MSPTQDNRHFVVPAGTAGRVLTTERCQELSALAESGYEELAALQIRNPKDNSFGAELEELIVGADGSPLGVGPTIEAEVNDIHLSDFSVLPGNLSREFTRFDIEINLAAQFGPPANFLQIMFVQILSHLATINGMAQQSNGQLVSCGILPSMTPEHLGPSWITESDRFAALQSGLLEYAKKHPDELEFAEMTPRGLFKAKFGSTGLFFEGPEGAMSLGLEQGGMVAYNGVGTSSQFHFGMANQDELVLYLRVAELISPIVNAPCANSPLLFGYPTGALDSRLFVLSAMLNPRRFFLPNRWADNPLDQLRSALRRDPVIDPVIGGKEAHSRGDLKPIQAALEHAKTCWPPNRVVTSPNLSDRTVVHRLEGRSISSGPTPMDIMGAAALYLGLIRGMPDYLHARGIDMRRENPGTELEKKINFLATRINLFKACTNGLQSKILWLGEKEVAVRDLLDGELFEVAQKGLDLFGCRRSDIDRFLGVIKRRLNFRLGDQLGVTPADILMYLYNNHFQDQAPEQRCQSISLCLADMLARGISSQGGDILDWFERSNYCPTR